MALAAQFEALTTSKKTSKKVQIEEEEEERAGMIVVYMSSLGQRRNSRRNIYIDTHTHKSRLSCESLLRDRLPCKKRGENQHP